MICLIRPLAQIKDVTPSSQAKKSTLEVRSGICVTVGKRKLKEVTKVVMQQKVLVKVVPFDMQEANYMQDNKDENNCELVDLCMAKVEY